MKLKIYGTVITLLLVFSVGYCYAAENNSSKGILNDTVLNNTTIDNINVTSADILNNTSNSTNQSMIVSLKDADKVGVYDPTTGTWALWDLANSSIIFTKFGGPEYKPIVGDWNGDGFTKLGIYNEQTNNFTFKNYQENETLHLGWAGITPVVGTGQDGKDRVIVYDSNGTWARWNSQNGSTDKVNTTYKGATLISGDWNGDKTSDLGIYNGSAGTFILPNQNETDFNTTISLPIRGAPVAGDWDGNGKDEVGIFDTYTGNWALWNSTSNSTDMFNFGWPVVTPIVGDWDGNGKDEVGVYNSQGNNFALKNNSNKNDTSYHLIGLGWYSAVPVIGKWNETNVTLPMEENVTSSNLTLAGVNSTDINQSLINVTDVNATVIDTTNV